MQHCQYHARISARQAVAHASPFQTYLTFTRLLALLLLLSIAGKPLGRVLVPVISSLVPTATGCKPSVAALIAGSPKLVTRGSPELQHGRLQ